MLTNLRPLSMTCASRLRPTLLARLAVAALCLGACDRHSTANASAGATSAATSDAPANTPAFASSGIVPDEGTVLPIAKNPAHPLRIAVLGMEDSPFWIPVKVGLERARHELAGHNTTVDWIVAGDNHTAEVFGRAIDAAVAKQYDAIVTIAGDAGVAAYIDRAVGAGVPVATFNSETDTPNRRLFFVGADSHAQGVAAGTRMCKVVGPTAKVAVITGFFAVEAHQARVTGFEDALKANCPGVTIVGRSENQDRADLAYQQAKDFMTAHADLDGIVATAGSPFGAARAVEEAGRGGKLHLVTFDAVPETMDYVDRSVVDATIGQDPDAQGHDPVIRMYNYLVAGTMPPFARLVTRADVIDRSNAARFRTPPSSAR